MKYLSLITITLLVLFSNTHCKQPEEKHKHDHDGNKAAAVPSVTPSQPAAAAAIPSVTQTIPGTTPTPPFSATQDVVLVNVIGNENTNLKTQQIAAFDQLLTRIGQKYGQRSEFRLALIASRSGSVSGIPLSIQAKHGFLAQNTKQLDMVMATDDVLLGLAIAGCQSSTNSLPGLIAGPAKVCGTSVTLSTGIRNISTPSFSGKLFGFLRPGTSRTFIIVAANDARTLAASFLATVKTSNNNSSVRVYAIAPTTINGTCTTRNAVATNLSTVVSASGGRVFSYCDSNWTPHIDQILSEL